MVWFEYILESMHGDTVVSPKTPRSPKSPTSPKFNIKRRITEEDAIDIYFFMKQVCYDSYYDGCLLNIPEFNSFSIQHFINTKRFNETIDEPEFYKDEWLPTYRDFIDILLEYTNRQLSSMGKRVSIPRRLFQRVVYHFSDGFITQS